MAGNPFTSADDRKIREMLAAGHGDYAIGTVLGRNKSSVHRRIEILSRAPARICRCGRRVNNDDVTDYRFCETCRGVMHYTIGVGVFVNT